MEVIVSEKSPFADFYDQVFAETPKEKQEEFLRKLFSMNASICASFSAYIDPPIEEMAISDQKAAAEIITVQDKLNRYDWETLYDIDPTADDYISEIWDLLDREIIDSFMLEMEANCSIGDLLSAINAMRIIELGTNIDWEQLDEPACYYPKEVKMHIRYKFQSLMDHFLDNVFSKELIQAAIDKVQAFKEKPGKYFNYTEKWESVLDVFKDRLQEKI